MPLRFFADHCIPNSIIQELQDAGCSVLRLKDHIPIESPDSKVIEITQEFDAILLSLNGDFTNILNYPPDRYKGIIAFQVRNHPETIPYLMRRLLSYISLHPDMDFYKGKLILLEVHRIRIQK
jgi:predicted nuclease of predicted toxin-antitoxin system